MISPENLPHQARVRQHKLKLPKNPGMAGLGLDMMAGGSIFDSDVVDTPSMALVDPVLGGQVLLICLKACLSYLFLIGVETCLFRLLLRLPWPAFHPQWQVLVVEVTPLVRVQTRNGIMIPTSQDTASATRFPTGTWWRVTTRTAHTNGSTTPASG